MLRDARNMAADVHKILVDVIREYEGKTEADAVAFLKMLSTKKRYQQDVWS